MRIQPVLRTLPDQGTPPQLHCHNVTSGPEGAIVAHHEAGLCLRGSQLEVSYTALTETFPLSKASFDHLSGQSRGQTIPQSPWHSTYTLVPHRLL